jgi:integrase/recombinase XerD
MSFLSRDFKASGEHRILNLTGKGGKERITPLHLEAVERLAAWLCPALPTIRPGRCFVPHARRVAWERTGSLPKP